MSLIAPDSSDSSAITITAPDSSVSGRAILAGHTSLQPGNGAPSVPAFPEQLLAPLWRGWANDAAAVTGAPLDCLAMALLAAAASCVGDKRRVAPIAAWTEPCMLWTTLVGEASSARSAALVMVRQLLAGARPWRIAAGQPTVPTFVVSESGVLRLQVAADTEVLVRDAESVAPDILKPRLRSNASVWKAAFSSQSKHLMVSSVRTGKTRMVQRFSMAAAVTAQELADALVKADEGLLCCMLYACPGPTSVRPMKDIVEADEQAVCAALGRLDALTGKGRDLRLSSQALQAFEAFRQSHALERSELAGLQSAWWGQGPSMVLRLAGVLALMDWAVQQDCAEPERIEADKLRDAIALWRDYLWPHARAALGARTGERQSHTAVVLRFMQQHRFKTITRQQMRREALAQKVDAEGTEDLAAELVARGWLRPDEPQQSQQRGRGRPPRQWQVNPALHEGIAGNAINHAAPPWPEAATGPAANAGNPHGVSSGTASAIGQAALPSREVLAVNAVIPPQGGAQANGHAFPSYEAAAVIAENPPRDGAAASARHPMLPSHEAAAVNAVIPPNGGAAGSKGHAAVLQELLAALAVIAQSPLAAPIANGGKGPAAILSSEALAALSALSPEARDTLVALSPHTLAALAAIAASPRGPTGSATHSDDLGGFARGTPAVNAANPSARNGAAKANGHAPS